MIGISLEKNQNTFLLALVLDFKVYLEDEIFNYHTSFTTKCTESLIK